MRNNIAILQSLFRGLVENGAVKTTQPRAKLLKSFADRLVSQAKKDGVLARRRVLSQLRGDKKLVQEFFGKTLPTLGKRQSGFVRIKKLGERRSDHAPLVRVEWAFTEKENSKHEARNSKQIPNPKP